ncbi:MAG: hypothetical protein MSA89_13510 [Clostridium sp.]|nr:hypothetical protein [Clostridium sp.]
MSAFSLEILNVTQCPFVNRKMGCLGTSKFLRNKISFECDITCFSKRCLEWKNVIM